MKGELNLIGHFLFKAWYTYLIFCRSNGDPGYSQQIGVIQSENSYPLLIVKNFQIVEGGSKPRKDILLNELRFHYAVKRRNSSVFTWLCTFWGIKEKKACNVTSKGTQRSLHRKPSPHTSSKENLENLKRKCT